MRNDGTLMKCSVKEINETKPATVCMSGLSKQCFICLHLTVQGYHNNILLYFDVHSFLVGVA